MDKKKEKLNERELIKNISKDKMNSFTKLGHSHVVIRQLVDFMQVLNKNEEDYKDEVNIRICKTTELHPSDILSHYIYLEAFKFYENLSHWKKMNKSLPNLPPYIKKLKKARNKFFAHRDTRGELPLAEDVIRVLNELSKQASTEKIIDDVYKTYNSIKNE